MIYIFLALLVWSAFALSTGVIIRHLHANTPIEKVLVDSRECEFYDDLIRLELENFGHIKSMDAERHIRECPQSQIGHYD